MRIAAWIWGIWNGQIKPDAGACRRLMSELDERGRSEREWNTVLDDAGEANGLQRGRGRGSHASALRRLSSNSNSNSNSNNTTTTNTNTSACCSAGSNQCLNPRGNQQSARWRNLFYAIEADGRLTTRQTPVFVPVVAEVAIVTVWQLRRSKSEAKQMS